MITLIAAIGLNNEIGFKNKLLWNIPEDMKHFRSYTMGKVIVMGSNTFASIGNKPLPGRKCIVLSSHPLGCMAIRAKSIDDIISVNHCYPEIVIIGGASVYNQMMPFADKLVITHVDAEFVADTFFPAINLEEWTKTLLSESHNEKYEYKFVEYTK